MSDVEKIIEATRSFGKMSGPTLYGAHWQEARALRALLREAWELMPAASREALMVSKEVQTLFKCAEKGVTEPAERLF